MIEGQNIDIEVGKDNENRMNGSEMPVILSHGFTGAMWTSPRPRDAGCMRPVRSG